MSYFIHCHVLYYMCGDFSNLLTEYYNLHNSCLYTYFSQSCAAVIEWSIYNHCHFPQWLEKSSALSICV